MKYLRAFSSLIVFALGCTSTLIHAAPESGKTLPSPIALPDFQLVNQDAKAISAKDFRGHWSMIVLGFTSCPDVCPFTLALMSSLRKELRSHLTEAALPEIIFVAVDPTRDQSTLKQYLNYFDPTYVGITGEKSEIDKLVKGLGGAYRLQKKTPQDQDYLVMHSAEIPIINPCGQRVAALLPPFKPAEAADYFRQLFNEGKDCNA